MGKMRFGKNTASTSTEQVDVSFCPNPPPCYSEEKRDEESVVSDPNCRSLVRLGMFLRGIGVMPTNYLHHCCAQLRCITCGVDALRRRRRGILNEVLSMIMLVDARCSNC